MSSFPLTKLLIAIKFSVVAGGAVRRGGRIGELRDKVIFIISLPTIYLVYSLCTHHLDLLKQ